MSLQENLIEDEFLPLDEGSASDSENSDLGGEDHGEPRTVRAIRLHDLQERVRARRRERNEPHKILLEAGKRQLRQRQKQKILQDRINGAVQKFDGVTQLCISEQNQFQSVFIRRSEQSWDIAKQLRTMGTTVRRAAEGRKESLGTLQNLEQRVLDLRQLTNGTEETPGNNEDNNEVNATEELQEMAMAHIRRGQERKRIMADAEVDAEVAMIDGADASTTGCPHCGRVMLKEYIENHVLECKEMQSRPKYPRGQGGKNAIPVAASKYRELELKMQMKARERLESFDQVKRASFLATVLTCPECGKGILASHLQTHLRKCREQQRIRVFWEEQSRSGKLKDPARRTLAEQAEQLGVMKPLPPQDLRLVSVTSDSIELAWEPPIFTGGYNLDIHDYIIEYAVQTTRYHRKKPIIEVTEQPAVSTSRFCALIPVNPGHFILDNLNASTSYTHIRVRAKNKAGLSEPSNEVGPIATDAPVQPSPPLMLMLAAASQESLTFVWSDPVNTGGAPGGIKRYEITYEMIDQQSVKDERELRHMKSFVEAPCLCFVIDGLSGHSKVWNIKVVAVTEGFNNQGDRFELRSEPSNLIKEVTTLESDREDALRSEIRRISCAANNFVDSAAYNGFAQRYRKDDLLTKLNKDLLAMETQKNRRAKPVHRVWNAFPPDLLYKAFGMNLRRESLRTATRKGKLRRDHARASVLEAKKVLGLPEAWRRRRHFEYRIKKHQEELNQLEQNRSELILRRSVLTRQLDQEERRASSLHAELDRASAHTGEYLDSQVMHGRMQRFRTWALRDALHVEIRAMNEKLAIGKREQIEIERKLQSLRERVEQVSEALKDRKARLVLFEKEVSQREKALDRVRGWRERIQYDLFHRWAEVTRLARLRKGRSSKIVFRMQNRELYRAWTTWRGFVQMEIARESRLKELSGTGSSLLEQARLDRINLEGTTAEVLFSLRTTAEHLDNVKHTEAQRKDIRKSAFFNIQEDTILTHVKETPEEFAQDLVKLKQGEAYLSMANYEKAHKCFEGYLKKQEDRDMKNQGEEAALRSGWADFKRSPEEEKERQEIQTRELLLKCECYFGMARCMQKLGRLDKSIVNFDRMRSLAVEAKSDRLKGLALLGVAQCNSANSFHKIAIEFADRALLVFEDLNDRPNQAKACRQLQTSYGNIYDEENSLAFEKRAATLELELESKVEDTFQKIKAAELKLVSVTADRSQVVNLELVSAFVPDLRLKIEERRSKVEEILAVAKAYMRLNASDSKRLEEIKEQLRITRECNEDELDSDLVHGILQRFKVKQLEDNLEHEAERLEKEIERRKVEVKNAEVRASNALDDMQGLEQDLRIELGDLMRRTMMSRQQFRYVALNPVNVRSRNVAGMATGGVERLAACIRDSIYIFDLRDGALLGILDGSKVPLPAKFAANRKKNPDLPIPGHHGSITALVYSERRIISGGVDRMIRVWEDRRPFRCELLLRGHESTIWSLWADHSKIVSGDAEHCVRVWSLKQRGSCVRVIRALHNRSITCLDIDHYAMATAGPDMEVRVWPYALDPTASADPKQYCKKFIGHGCPISCIKLTATELVSGGEDGRVFIWDVVSGTRLHICLGHTGPIRALQADATKLVSASLDKTIIVFDISSANPLLTLRGHDDKILGMQFDSYRVLSVSADGCLRYWFWSGNKDEILPTQDKLHVLQDGETLATLEKIYGVPSKKLMQWNNLKDVGRTLYVGMRLIVQKAHLTSTLQARPQHSIV